MRRIQIVRGVVPKKWIDVYRSQSRNLVISIWMPGHRMIRMIFGRIGPNRTASC